MLVLSRKLDYALVCLAHLAERQGVRSSARQIADAHDLPAAMTMQILKRLHRRGLVSSVRGAGGGYRLADHPRDLSLQELVEAIEEPGIVRNEAKSRVPHGPVRALHYRIRQFFHDVKLSDLVLPGRRIDIPIEMLNLTERTQTVSN